MRGVSTAALTITIVACTAASACQRSRPDREVAAARDSDAVTDAAAAADSLRAKPGWWTRFEVALGILPDSDDDDASDYEGHDSRGVPRYATQPFSQEDSLILRRAYGVEDPHRLYVSDSTDKGILEYDTRTKQCRSCLVNSYDIGFTSVRRPDESWEQAERRVQAARARRFTGGPHPMSYSTADLDPTIRAGVDRMLDDAAAAGFKLRIIATYRSPERQAYLMSLGGNRTHTLTSSHSYGRALDLVVDDGNRAHKKTKADWIAFRIWVTRYRAPTGETFRVLGAMDHTWDWPHVEVPSDKIGFRSIDDALERGRTCLAAGATTPCDFAPNLPPQLIR
ncbi:MAG: hypothetical protein ACREPM_08115 [Gemmatimonadaceae bacterium]